MNRYHLSFALLCLLAPIISQAQTPNPIPPPREPILARAPDHAEWTVTYRPDRDKALAEAPLDGSPKKDAAGESSSTIPQTVQVSKDGHTYREITRWPDGREAEKWISDGLQVRTGSKDRIMRIMPPGVFYAPDYSDYSRSDFEPAEWVSKTNFKGAHKYKGIDVYVFEVEAGKRRLTPRETADRATGGAPQPIDPSRKSIAYLEVKTQQPLLIDDGETVYTYQHAVSPPPALSIPTRFADALALWKKDIKRKTSVPLPP